MNSAQIPLSSIAVG